MPVAADIYYHAYLGGEEGKRPPVVLIHGAGGTHLYWPSEIRRLPDYRVFALDLPGHGKSGGRAEQSISGYTGMILEWLEAAGLHSAVFVGHSMGSAIALSLALDHAEHVLGLGLVGAGSRLPVDPALLEITASSTTFHNAVRMVVERSFDADTPEQLTELAARRMAETRPSVLHSDFLACNAFDETERICEIHQPAMMVCGAEDLMTPQRYSRFLNTCIPHSQLVVVPNAGHMVMLEQPQAVATALSDFLAGINY